MPINKIKGLKGLRGLGDLSEEERSSFLSTYSDKLSKYSTDPVTYGKAAQILYKNRQFIDRYGEDMFDKLSPEDRSTLYRNEVVNDAIQVYKDDPWFPKISSMDTDSKITLLESDWLTSAQINEQIKARQDALSNYYLSPQMPGSMAPPSVVTVGGSISEDIHEHFDRGKNDKLIERIYAKDLERKQRSRETSDAVNSVLSSKDFSDMTPEQVETAFVQAITPSENNMGCRTLAAYYNEGGDTVEEELENYDTDKKKEFLAKKAVYEQIYGIGTAADILDNEAKNYISDNQSGWTYTGLLLKDIGISTLSYTADKFNSIRMIGLALADSKDDGVQVFRTLDGEHEVVPTAGVIEADGKYFYNGREVTPVMMDRTTLDLMGKDSNGETRDAFWNQQFWSDAEQFGTLDHEEIAKYKKLGVSPYKVAYKAGDESSIGYEALKMTSFALADVASMAIPMGIGQVGAALKATSAFGKLTKPVNALGKGLVYTSKGLRRVTPTIGATAIGNAYGRGLNGEGVQQNLANLDEVVNNNIIDEFQNDYKDNPDIKADIDNRIAQRAKELKALYLKNSSFERGTMYIDSPELNDMCKRQAMEDIKNEEISRRIQSYKETPEYVAAVNEAYESAGDAALAASFSTGVKYFFVNNGFRSHLFKTPLQKSKEAMSKMYSGVSEIKNAAGKFRLTAPSTYATLGQKFGHFGKALAKQGWGGAWTNATDELQSEGGRNINEDRYSAYLQGLYDPEASATTYSILEGMASYMGGVTRGLANENTWRAGLIGAIGSYASFAPNVASFMSGNFRAQWKQAQSFGEKASLLLSNGVLSEYYAGKQAERDISRHIQYVNNIMDQYEDFQIIQDAVALDLASKDAVNMADKTTIDLLKVMSAVELLNRFQAHDETNVADAEVASRSTVMQRALETMDKILNVEQLSQEDKDALLGEYYAKNPNMIRSEVTDEAAINQLVNNAKALQKGLDVWNAVEQILVETEKTRGERIPDNIRYELKKRFALDSNWKEQLATLEREISGSESSSFHRTIESFGTVDAVNAMLSTISKDFGTIFKEKEKAKDKVKEAQAALDKEKALITDRTREEAEFSNAEAQALLESIRKKQLDLDNAKLQVEYFDRISYYLTSLKIDLESTPVSNRPLTTPEILRLSPEDRARMLNPQNLSNYSTDQQRIIKQTVNELNMRDPQMLDKIQDAAILANRITSNSDAYSKILDNPYAALVIFEAQREAVADITRQIPIRRSVESIDRFLTKMQTEPSIDADNVSDEIYRNLRVLHPSILRYYKGSGLPMAAKYITELDRAIEWVETIDDLNATVNTQSWEDARKASAKAAIDSIVESSNTKEELFDSLERVLNSPDVAPEVKKDFETILNGMQEIGYQRDATRVQDRQAKKDREKKLAEEKAEREAQQASIESKSTLTNVEDVNLEESTEVPQVEQTETPIEVKVDEATLEDVDLGNISEVTTPQSLREEVEQLPDAKVTLTPVSEIDEVEVANDSISTPSSTIMISNPYYRYALDALKTFGRLELRTPKDEGDKLDTIWKWFDTVGINLQEIIDNELGKIRDLNPDVQYIFVKPEYNAMNDIAMQRELIQVVEYTDEVKKIHNEFRGGVIGANGKQWLVIGIQRWSNPTQMELFNNMTYEMAVARKRYFDANPKERFYVNDKYRTKIADIAPGRIVKQLLTDKTIQIRTITELLSDPKRNPDNLKLEDLKWGIQKGENFGTVNVSSRNKVYSPGNKEGNNGAVFLLIRSANGGYLSAKILPTMLKELRDGEFKTEVYNLLNKLLSINHSERLAAINSLVQKLVLDKDNNILIGDKTHNTVSIKRNGVIIKTFDLNNTEFTTKEFIDYVETLNPRIQIGLGALSNVETLRQLDEAGALTTDIAILGSANANHSVYACNSDGTPIIETPISNSPEVGEYSRVQQHSVLYLGQVYREVSNQFYDKVGKLITDPIMLTQLRYNQRIQSNDMKPCKVDGPSEFYIIDSEKNVVVKRDINTHYVTQLSEEVSRKMIEDLAKEAEQTAREKAAERNQKALSDGTFTISNTENVDLGLPEQPITDEIITQQMQGNFEITNTEEVIENSEPEPSSEPSVEPNETTDNGINGSARTFAEEHSEIKSFTLSDVLRSTEFGDRLDSLIEAKIEEGLWEDAPDDIAELEIYFNKKGITTVGIRDVDKWLKMIEDCK